MHGGRLAAAVAMVVASAVLSAGADAAETAQLPDLGMARVTDVRIEKLPAPDGRKVLRFTSEVVNVGPGPFQVVGTRASTSAPMTGKQQVGGSPVGQPVEFVYSGDNHNHWHVKKLANYVLKSSDGRKSRTGEKVGFCFWDGHAYRNPGPVVFGPAGCGTQDSLSLNMGLSPGYGDIYPWYLTQQWVDVTNLARGKYRLTVTADAQNAFVETSETNNSSWIDIKIGRGTKVSVLATGPGA